MELNFTIIFLCLLRGQWTIIQNPISQRNKEGTSEVTSHHNYRPRGCNRRAEAQVFLGLHCSDWDHIKWSASPLETYQQEHRRQRVRVHLRCHSGFFPSSFPLSHLRLYALRESGQIVRRQHRKNLLSIHSLTGPAADPPLGQTHVLLDEFS